MERDATGVEADVAGLRSKLERHLGGAAELARQRPVGALAGHQDAAEHPGARRRARHLLELVMAVEGEEPQPRSKAKAMSLSFLIVLPKESRSARPRWQAEFDLAAAGDVEIGALRSSMPTISAAGLALTA